MEKLLEIWIRFLLDLWQNATLVDYARLALMVVVTAWFVDRVGKRVTSR